MWPQVLSQSPHLQQDPATLVLAHRLPSAKSSASQEERAMARCDQCGNDYDKAFQISMAGRTMTFASFECAIQKLAPSCEHCGCRIIGHGVEAAAAPRG